MSLSPRERALILTMVILGVGAVAYTLVISPQSEARISALAEIDRYERTVQALDKAAGDAMQRPRTTDTRPVPAIVAESARDGEIPIRRLEPEGELTRVVLANVEFDALMTWLAILDAEYAVQVASIEMERRPEPGIVIARIALER